MNWNDVTNKLVEIESLQQLLTIKISDSKSKEIIARYNKYHDITKDSINKLNNAAFLEFLQQDVKESASLIKNTTKELMENLSKNERSKLLQEMIPLSYDRNAFTYIDEIKTIKSIYKNPTVPLRDELYIYKLLLYFKETVYISLEEYFSKQDISKLISFFEEVLSIKEDKIKKV